MKKEDDRATGWVEKTLLTLFGGDGGEAPGGAPAPAGDSFGPGGGGTPAVSWRWRSRARLKIRGEARVRRTIYAPPKPEIDDRMFSRTEVLEIVSRDRRRMEEFWWPMVMDLAND